MSGSSLKPLRRAMVVLARWIRSLRSSVRGQIDARRLRRAHSLIWASTRSEERSATLDLREPYREYVRSVSTPDMAVSLELAEFLLRVCRSVCPRAVADLGSGFSSFALRKAVEGSKPSAAVWSVDDDSDWLGKTGAFLSAHGALDDRLYLWSDFVRIAPSGGFDIVLFDLGHIHTRMSTLPQVLPLLAPGGLLILDDVHKQAYASAASSLLRRAGFSNFSLRAFTRDSFGRYAQLSIAPVLSFAAHRAGSDPPA